MSLSILRKEIKDRRNSIGVVSASLAGFALLFAGMYKSVAGDLGEILGSFPAGFEAIIGDFGAISQPEGWLGIELYSLFLPFAIAIAAILYGANTIGKEEESGTLELLLASPISRSKLIIQKSLGLAVQAAIIAGSTWVGVFMGTLIFDFDVSLINVFWASFAAWLLGMLYGYFSLAVQSVKGSRSFGLAAGAGLLAATYFAQVLSELIDQLDFLKYLSPFHYFDVQAVLLNGPNVGYFAVLAACSIAFYTVAHLSFKQRDTGV